jgi:hypothetical protein
MTEKFGICVVCGDDIEYLDPTGDGLAAWWAHRHHPVDGHDAAPVKAVDYGER